MGNFTISMVIFHSYVKLPEGMLHLGMEDAFFVVMDPQGPSQSQYGSEKSRKKPSKTMFFLCLPAQSSPTLAKYPSNICSHRNIEFTAFPTKEILRYRIHQKSGFRQPAKGDPPIPDDEDSLHFFGCWWLQYTTWNMSWM